jgi:hypothetical protein
MPIADVLRAMAAQEGCDGPPWDQMQAAAEYIEKLESLLSEAAELIGPTFMGGESAIREIRSILGGAA